MGVCSSIVVDSQLIMIVEGCVIKPLSSWTKQVDNEP